MAIEFMVAIMAVGGITILMLLRLSAVPTETRNRQHMAPRREA